MSAKSNITSEQFEKQYMNYVNNRDKIYKEQAQYICKLKDQLHNKNELAHLIIGMAIGFATCAVWGLILDVIMRML